MPAQPVPWCSLTAPFCERGRYDYLHSLSGSELAAVHRQLAPHAQLEIPVVSLLAGVGKPTTVADINGHTDDLKGMAIASSFC